jgi:predicted GH43/DUF377 family glycosyl hydrolase
VQWLIAGAGDFSGDGRTDLVWHNPLTGQLHVWVMNGTSRTGMLTIDEGTDPALRVVATGDLNDDGRPDIVLQHQVTFALSAWLMSEGARTAVVELAAVEAGWRVQGLAPPRAGESITALIDRSVEREWGSAAAGSVLDVDSAARWRSEAVALPSAVVDGNRVLMYFAGVEATDNPYVSRVRVGLAVSEDGRAFHIANEGAPVFTEGPEGAFDSHSVSHPMVLRVDHEWWMYYAGADGTQGDDGVRVERLGLARSTDGITWTRLAEPVLDIGRAGAADSSQVASPFVLRIGGTFHLWYGAYGGTHRIAYATSADGVHWVKHGTVRGLRGAAAGELGPVVQFDGREFLMFYNSVDENHQWTLYAARSTDGQSWTAVNAGQPIVTNAPEGTFAEAGPNRNSAVHLSNLIPVGDDLLGYYTGEDLQSILRIGILRFVRR